MAPYKRLKDESVPQVDDTLQRLGWIRLLEGFFSVLWTSLSVDQLRCEHAW